MMQSTTIRGIVTLWTWYSRHSYCSHRRSRQGTWPRHRLTQYSASQAHLLVVFSWPSLQAEWLLFLALYTNAARYHHRLSSAFGVIDNMHLPHQLRNRIHQYFDHLWAEHDAVDVSEITNFTQSLSPSLEVEVRLFQYMDLVHGVQFWRNCSADFITQIMLNLDVKVYLREDYVMRQGEIGDNLFLINRGVCELRAAVNLDESSEESVLHLQPMVRRMTAGVAFGELALLMNYRRTATVRALTFVDMCVLGRDAFQRILARYRDDRREVLREIIFSCIEKKELRFIPLPFEGLVEDALGQTGKIIRTSWDIAEILVNIIEDPEQTDESVKFGFRDLDLISGQRLIPLGRTEKSRSYPQPIDNDIMSRLSAMKKWQVQTTGQLMALERTMQDVSSALQQIREALGAQERLKNDNPTKDIDDAAPSWS